MTEPALFDHPEPAIRKGAKAYLLAISGTYSGPDAAFPMWALAPIDRYVREAHNGDPVTSDFVWLIVDGRPTWALVDTAERTIIELDPAPRDRGIRELLATTQPVDNSPKSVDNPVDNSTRPDATHDAPRRASTPRNVVR